MTKQKNKPRRRLAAIITAVLFLFLGVMIPALHAHEEFGGPAASAHASVIRSSDGQGRFSSVRAPIAISDDQCALCQWLITGTYVTLESIGIFLLLITASALLTITARLAALCARPTPRRGLRAPPLCCIAA